MATERKLAGLACDDFGESDDRPALVLLHGLTFDRTTWGPALTELERVDPGRRALSFDLPGHGDSPALESYDLEAVAAAVHGAVEEAGLDTPIVVGHSISGMIASIYAGRYPTRGVVNVDQPLQTDGFVAFVQSIADQLRGPAFPSLWEQFAASMHAELLPEDAQEIVRSASNPKQELVLSYWRDVLERPADELAQQMATGFAALREAGFPYLYVTGAEPEPDYRTWLAETIPQATITVLPNSGHFPQLGHPAEFAQCLADTAAWT